MNFRLCAPVPLCATLTAAMLDQLSQDCFCPADGAWPPPAFDRWRRKIKEQIKADQRNDLDGRAANDSHHAAGDSHQAPRETHQTLTITPPISAGTTADCHRS
jgi:hypothetical protein